MNFKLFGPKTVIIGVALIVGIAGSAFSLHYGAAQAGVFHAFPKNQYGQTYGSELNATTPDTEPDLIAATGVGGVNGYLKRTDLEPDPFPKTPQDAIELTKKNLARGEYQIPLYAVDGKTIIGAFKISKVQATETNSKGQVTELK